MVQSVLEDQLLGDVVRTERPEIEERRTRLVLSIAADRKQLKEFEDKILRNLSESSVSVRLSSARALCNVDVT